MHCVKSTMSELQKHSLHVCNLACSTLINEFVCYTYRMRVESYNVLTLDKYLCGSDIISFPQADYRGRACEAQIH